MAPHPVEHPVEHPDEVRVGISRLHHPVLTLGPGRRIGIWFQGCSIHCAGCMSRDTWDPASDDDLVPLASVTRWVDAVAADDPAIDGITVSGGEPLDQPEALLALARWLRERFDPDAVDVLVYSGYPLDLIEARHPAVVGAVDALITEPFRQQAQGQQLRWRGSPNQRLVTSTELGRRRYTAHVDAAADTGLQVDVHDGRIQIVGVPRPGDLRRIEDGLARRGIGLEGCTWNREDSEPAEPTEEGRR